MKIKKPFALVLLIALGGCMPREYPAKPVPPSTSEKQYDPQYDYSRIEKKGNWSEPTPLMAVGGVIRAADGLREDEIDVTAAQELTTAISKRGGFILLDRGRIGEIVAEKTLFDPGPEILRRLCEIERAEYYLAGVYRKTQGDESRGKWRMDVKVIDVKTTHVRFGMDVYANTPSALSDSAADALLAWVKKNK
jgi:hypothetical protein